MNDIKNIFIAWASSASVFLAAIDGGTLITIVSAIVLPIVFFSVGKTVDVLLQMHFARRKEDKQK